MRFTDIFIRRPVLASVVSLLILLVGLRSLQLLNVREFPKTTNAVVTVTTVYTGADAELVQGFITTKLENQIASADGIDYLESSSSQGVSMIKAHLRLNYDPNDALTQITAKVNQVVSQLPAESEQPTIDVAVGDTTDSMYIAFYSDTMESNQITDYLLRVVQPKLATVPGVQQAEILGGRTFAMRIWLNPDKMAALGVAPADIRDVLAQNNYLAAVGKTKGMMVSVPLQASTDLHSADQFRNLVIKREGNATIRLGDVATVDLGAQDYDSIVRFNGKPANFMGIKVLPSANPLTVVRDVKKMLPEIQAQAPPGLQIVSPYDVTEYINLSIKEVLRTLVEALVIVMVVIFLFLGSVRTVLIPVLAIPLSLIGAAFFMLTLGFSINLLTLLAMVLAIGLVVDDAIVVVENIERHIEDGRKPLEAALIGARELGGPVIAMTITLAAVYAPIGFMGGLTGTLFTEFAFTLASAVIVSGVMALTLSPMLCSRILRPHTAKTGLVHFLDEAFSRLRRVYQHFLDWTLDFRPVTLVFAALVLAGCYFLFSLTKSELAPNEDQGFLMVQMTGPANASIEYMDRYGQAVSDRITSVKEAVRPFLILGGGGSMGTGPNTGFTGINLVPWDQRTRTQMEIAPDIQRLIYQVAGLQSVVFPLPPLPAGGDGLPVQFVIGSTDSPLAIYDRAQELLKRARESGLFMFADIDLKYDLPQTVVQIDRDKAADLGLDMQEVGADLSAMLGGHYVNWFSIQGRSYQVIPQIERSQRLNPDQLNSYYIRTGSGDMVPLSTIVSLHQTTEPEQLLRFQQLNSATLSGVPAPGVSMGQVLDYLRAQAKEVLPRGFSIDYAGQSRQYVQESGGLVLTFFFALIVIYLVLAALFESFRDPLVMLITVPMSIFGALLFLAVGFATLNIYTQVGLITLIGLISKHGILIVQFANQLQEREGMAKREAIENAAAIRLRPVLMTTAAMILGVSPLLFASGPGSVSRFDIGLVIASGMGIGTLFTLFVVPTMYMVLAKDHSAGKKDADTGLKIAAQ